MLYVIRWVHDKYFYQMIKIGVPQVGEVMECKFQTCEIFADVVDQSFETLAGNAVLYLPQLNEVLSVAIFNEHACQYCIITVVGD